MHRFELRLLNTDAWPRVDAVRVYDANNDNITSLLDDACDILEQSGVGFTVRMCSDDYWPVTTSVDLSVVLEQLPRVLTELLSSSESMLDFYEQGVERRVRLVLSGSRVTVTCSWLFTEKTECIFDIDRSEVMDELCSLAEGFLSVARLRADRIACHPWFVGYSEKLEQLIARVRADSGALCE